MNLTLATNPFYLIIFYGKSNGMAFQYRSILFKQDFAKSIYKVKELSREQRKPIICDYSSVSFKGNVFRKKTPKLGYSAC